MPGIYPGAHLLMKEMDCRTKPGNDDEKYRRIGSMRQCGLQRLQLLKAAGELVALPAVLGVGHVFLGVLDLACEQAAVEILERNGHVREHGEASRIDLREAAVDDDLELATLAINRQDSRPQRRDQRGMPGEHAEVALGAWHVDLVDLVGEQKLLGRNKIEMEGGHRSTPPDHGVERWPPSISI